MILQCAGDNLGSRSAAPIRQQHQRNRRCDWIVAGDEGLILSVAGANAGDLLSLVQEQVADAQRLIEDAARITAQVDDDPLRALSRKLGYRVFDFVARALVELEQRDVADVAIEHDGVGHRRDVYDRPGEGDRNELRNTGAGELHQNSAAWVALQSIRRLRNSPATDVGGVDEIDAIAFLHARLFGWCVWENALHGYKALSFGDLHSDAGVTPVGLGIETRKLFRREKHAVWIVELVDKTARGLLIQCGLVDGIDEACGNDVQYLVEETRSLLALALLKYETARCNGDQDKACEQAFSDSGHAETRSDVKSPRRNSTQAN